MSGRNSPVKRSLWQRVACALFHKGHHVREARFQGWYIHCGKCPTERYVDYPDYYPH